MVSWWRYWLNLPRPYRRRRSTRFPVAIDRHIGLRLGVLTKGAIGVEPPIAPAAALAGARDLVRELRDHLAKSCVSGRNYVPQRNLILNQPAQLRRLCRQNRPTELRDTKFFF